MHEQGAESALQRLQRDEAAPRLPVARPRGTEPQKVGVGDTARDELFACRARPLSILGFVIAFAGGEIARSSFPLIHSKALPCTLSTTWMYSS